MTQSRIYLLLVAELYLQQEMYDISLRVIPEVFLIYQGKIWEKSGNLGFVKMWEPYCTRMYDLGAQCTCGTTKLPSKMAALSIEPGFKG